MYLELTQPIFNFPHPAWKYQKNMADDNLFQRIFIFHGSDDSFFCFIYGNCSSSSSSSSAFSGNFLSVQVEHSRLSWAQDDSCLSSVLLHSIRKYWSLNLQPDETNPLTTTNRYAAQYITQICKLEPPSVHKSINYGFLETTSHRFMWLIFLGLSRFCCLQHPHLLFCSSFKKEVKLKLHLKTRLLCLRT